MRILLSNEWYNPTIQNLIFHFTSILGPFNFNWTGKRWYRTDFLPINEIEESSYVAEPQAYSQLQDNHYDFVIFGDGSTHVYNSSHLKAKRIFIDTIDPNKPLDLYYNNSEIYFKCQMSINETKKMFPLGLLTSYKEQNINKGNYLETADVFFNGSSYPLKRVQYIHEIKRDKNIKFIGGVYNRDDLKFNTVIPDSIYYRKMNTNEYISGMSSSKICLSFHGNGENCFRAYEILHFGKFLLCEKSNNLFSFSNLIKGVHCDFFETPQEMIDKIHFYLKNENLRKEIANNGQEYYKTINCQKTTQYILDVLNDK